MAIAVAKRTLQNAAAATGAGSPLLVNGRGAAALQVTGTFVGTVTFEGTINEDLSTWVSIKGSNITNGTVAATATAPGVFSFNTTGLYSIRANITAYTSGSITVVGREIDGVFGPADMNITGSIPAGTNNIGDVDVLSIAAGDNNIGNVDVLTLPALPAGTNNIGDVDVLTLPSVTVDKITGISSTTISADNAAATITLAAPAAGVAHYVWGIIVGFVGGAATKLCTVKDGATVKENLPVVNSLTTERAKPLKITDATALEVSLAASGTAGIIGYVTVMYETR